LPYTSKDKDEQALVQHAADFASRHGIDAMLDTLAACYQAYRPMSQDEAIVTLHDLVMAGTTH
jgi:hypothetical protein